MGSRVSLLRIDPELGNVLSGDARRTAEGKLLVSVVSLEPGEWSPPELRDAGAALGLLLLDGFMIRRLTIGASSAIEPLGRGDLIRPWQEDAASFSRASWSVVEWAELAVLDGAFTAALARWPALIPVLLERAMRRSRWLAAEAAISNIVGMETRVLTVLWQLAERWGAFEEGGVVLSLPVTHDFLAKLVGARRPSVTQALGELTEAGKLRRLPDGRFRLMGDPPAA
jgi:CRP/FNR family transcriptional regulator, cyclic AMP receptor protein